MNIRYIFFILILGSVGNTHASSSEYLSPYFFVFSLIPFFILGPIGIIVGLALSKEKTNLIKAFNSLIGVILGYLLSYGLICLIELLKL